MAAISYPISDTERFLGEARRQFHVALDGESRIRRVSKEDIRFTAGDQWDPVIREERRRANRPAHTHNRLRTFVNQMVNEARQNKPMIRFSPVENADEATADVLTGMARHIQYDSQASVAYETAALYQGAGGFGYFRMLTEFCDYGPGAGVDQDIKIRTIPDPMSVYGVLLPAIRGQKCRHAFVCETMTRDEYVAQFGTSPEFSSFVDEGDGWITENEVRIAEYWRIEKDVVKFCKINGAEVLPDTEEEWWGSTIPIIPVLGETMIVDGQPQVNSLVRFMLDPQKLINYTKSRIAESLATSPISPFLVLEGQITGREQEWMTMNTTLRPVIQYKPVRMPDGTMFAQAPQRQTFEAPIAALSAFLAQEIDELKAISGIYDASLGNRSNETSGVAIERRKQQSDTANMHFMDNLARAHEQCGRILAEIIPKVYSGPRMVKILGEDEAQKVVAVNQAYRDRDGTTKYHDLSAGTYDVTVTTGQSYSTKKLESFHVLSELVQGNPQLLPMIGDIIFRNSDMAGAEEISDRFKKMLPPNLQDQPDGQQPIPPQAQQQMAAAQQQMAQMHAYAQNLEAEIQKLQAEKNGKVVDNEYKLKLEQMKIEAQLATAEINTNAQVVTERIGMINDLWQQLHSQSHDAAMQLADQGHEARMMAAQHGQQEDAANQAAAQQAQQPEEEPGPGG